MESLPEISPVLLVGGLGTRLRSAVPDKPKALATVAGKPFLAWLLENLARAGFQDALLCTGYQAELIQKAFGDTHQALRLRYSQEHTPLGTGGALRKAAPLIRTRFALVLNGDSFCNADLSGFCKNHLEQNHPASMLLAQVEDSARFGLVERDSLGFIRHLNEKTGLSQPGWINAGIYILPTDWLMDIPENCPVSLERDLFPLWIARRIQGVPTDGCFVDIGTPESFVEGDHLLQRLNARHSLVYPPV